jgi:hypothetical protein
MNFQVALHLSNAAHSFSNKFTNFIDQSLIESL